MVDLCIKAKAKNECSFFEPMNNIRIEYPGDKSKTGDYKAIIAGTMFSHKEMCIIIATYVLNGNMTYEKAVEFLDDVYENGTDTDKEYGPELQYLREIIFWTTLQEEINYPQEEWNRNHTAHLQGRRMSFNRYAEAIAAAAGRDGIKLDEVMRRASKHNVFDTLPIKDAPSYYR